MKATAVGAYLISSLLGGCRCDPEPVPTPITADHDCEKVPTCAKGEHAERGFCVPECRERGGEGCACQVDGTCSLSGDEPLSCIANVCRKERAAPAGRLSGSCSDSVPCAGELRCLSGECQAPDCPAGNRGCACGPYGSCGTYAGQVMRCTPDKVCAIAECTAKPNRRLPAGASCTSAASCEDGLTCRGGRCLLAEASLSVSGNQARACDIVVEAASSSKIESVTFTQRVRGESLARAPHTALSFFALDKGALTGTAARLEYRAGKSPELLQQTCYDSDGNVLAAAQVKLQ